MNLIEQLGGYERAKEIAFDPLHPQMTHVSNDGRHWVNEEFLHIPEIQEQIPTMIRIKGIRKALLDYRRQHNIFEVGDLVVIKDEPFWPEDYEIHTVEQKDIGRWYMSGWRHATDEEIKAGKRLEVNHGST